MVTVETMLLADGATQRPDGKLDIYGAGVGVIWARSFPCSHPRLVLLVRVRADADEAQHKMGLDIIDAHGRPIGPRVETQLQREPGARDEGVLQTLFQLEGMPFRQPGRYDFELIWDNDVIASLPFDVAHQAAA